MAQKEYTVTLTDYEKRVMLGSLMEVHNTLISQGNPTEDVDLLLKKVAYAPLRKEKRWSRSEAR